MGSVRDGCWDSAGNLGFLAGNGLFLLGKDCGGRTFSLVILKMLPDIPAKAAWLTTGEKAWLEGQLKSDGEKALLGPQRKAADASACWNRPQGCGVIGAYFFFALTTSYAL